jgi:Ran GTPase-activating protein (RanGAP) involved in mRNA processing and transport
MLTSSSRFTTLVEQEQFEKRGKRRVASAFQVIQVHLHSLSLKCVDVSRCGLDDSSARDLALGLAQCKRLEDLNVAFNRIGNLGSRYLVDACKTLFSLESVLILGNQLTRGIEWVEECVQLVFLNLALNPIENPMDCAEAAYKKKWSLFCVGVDGFGVEEIFTSVKIRNFCEVVQIEKSANFPDIRLLSIRSLSEEFDEYAPKDVIFGRVFKGCKLDFRNSGILDSELPLVFSYIYVNFKNVTVIDLSKNALSDIYSFNISELISSCTFLKQIYLNDNTLGDQGAYLISNSLENNESVEIINLSNNQIGDTGVLALLRSISKNHTLWKIYLASNLFDTDEMIKQSCSLMCIEKTDLNRFPRSFASFQTYVDNCILKSPNHKISFDFSWNEIGNAGIIYFAEVVHYFGNLRNLYLKKNGIGDSEAFILFEALKESKQLARLDLSDNKISNIGVQSLSNLLKCHTRNGIQVNLEYNEISDSGARELLCCMNLNSKIEKIALCCNPISAEACVQLELEAAFLSKQRFQLLSNNLYSDHKIIIKSLSRKVIECEASRKIALMLLNHPDHFKALDMSRCSIGDVQVKELCSALSKSSVEYIDLSENNISDLGCTYIGAMILCNSHSITDISISRNIIGCKGLDIICKALLENVSITKLGYTSVFDDGKSNGSSILIDSCLDRNSWIRNYSSRIEFLRWILHLKDAGDGVIQMIFSMADLD